MERFELEPTLKEEIRARVLGGGFMKLVQTVRRNGENFRISLRPVEIGGAKKFQAEMVDDGLVQVKNLSADAVAEGLEEILAQRGARDLHLMTAKGDLHLRVTKKGRAHVSRSAEMARVVTVLPARIAEGVGQGRGTREEGGDADGDSRFCRLCGTSAAVDLA